MEILLDMDIREILSLVSLGQIGPGDYRDMAEYLLEMGYDSETVCILAGQEKADEVWSRQAGYLEKMLAENNWVLPTEKEAAGNIIAFIKKCIAAGELPPLTGTKLIAEIYHTLKARKVYADRVGLWKELDIACFLGSYAEIMQIESFSGLEQAEKEILLNEIAEGINDYIGKCSA